MIEKRSVNVTTALLWSRCLQSFCTFAYIDKLKIPTLPSSVLVRELRAAELGLQNCKTLQLAELNSCKQAMRTGKLTFLLCTLTWLMISFMSGY